MNKSELKSKIREYTDTLKIQQTMDTTVREDGTSNTVIFSKGQTFTATLTTTEQEDSIAQCRDMDYFHYHLTRWCPNWK